MGSGFSKMKKQAKQMQEKYAKMQEEMQSVEAIGTSGNGLVTITLNGEKQIKKIEIKPDCVDKDDIEGLQDLIIAAYNAAFSKIEEKMPEAPFGNMPF